MKKRKFLLAGLVAICIVGGAAFLPRSARPVMVAPLSEGMALMPKAPWLDRFMPQWGWLWRLRDTVMPRRRISFDAAQADFNLTPERVLADLALGYSTFTTNGIRLWILDGNNLSELQRHLKQNSKSRFLRVETADGIRSGISITDPVSIDGKPNEAGLKMDLMPVVGRNSTDLTALLCLSEVVTNQTDSSLISIRTNLALAVRLEIPNGKGVFLLEAKQDATNRGSLGVIISPTFPKPKK